MTRGFVERSGLAACTAAIAVVLVACGTEDGLVEPAEDPLVAEPAPTPTPRATPEPPPAAPSPEPPAPPPASEEAEPAEEEPVDGAVPPAGRPLAEMIDRAVRDLAQQLRVERGAIEVIHAEEVTWPDDSLGCPEQRAATTQAAVDGYRVALGTGDRERVYLYHAGGDGEPFLCPSEDDDGGHEFVPPPRFDD